MNFELTEVQRDIKKMTRDFAAKELTPNARRCAIPRCSWWRA